MSVRREVRTPFTRFLERGHFYALGTDRFYVSVNMDVLVMYDSCYNRDSIFKRITFNEETYILIRDFLEKIRNNDYNDIDMKEEEVKKALLDNGFDIIDIVHMNDWVSIVAK